MDENSLPNSPDSGPPDTSNAREAGESYWLFPLLMFCILAPIIVQPIVERLVIVGPLCNIALSVAAIAVWNRFGPSSINGMVNGMVSILVLFFNIFAIILSLAALIGHIAAQI